MKEHDYNGPHADLTREIIAAAIDVHQDLGPGLLESAYEHCLAHLLSLRGICVARQVEFPITFRGLTVEAGFRMDMVVEGVVVVEIKAIDDIHPVHQAQVLTYLKLSKLRVGLIINFNVATLRTGIRRVVNG